MIRKGFRFMFGNVKYTKSHEWIESLAGGKYRVDQLGEIVHIEHSAVGKNFQAGTGVVTIQSVKTTADVYTPSNGKLVALNEEVLKNPSLINQKPDQSWIFEVVCETPPTNVIDKAEYDKFLQQHEH